MTETELNKAIRSTYRNKVDENGNPFGYGVVTGEETALAYLHSGVYSLEANSTIILFTDGYENYIKLDEFNKLFATWPEDLDERLKNLSTQKTKEDPKGFGQERSLLAVRI